MGAKKLKPGAFREPPFYILWNPLSSRPPTVRFSKRSAAEAGAERMAREYGGTFYVCRAYARQTRLLPQVELVKLGAR